MKIRPAHATDFYKTGHIFQYEPGCTEVYSNYTPRSEKYATKLPDFDHKVVNFGIQGISTWFLRDMWNDGFFKLPKEEVIGAYQRRMDLGLGVGAVPVGHMAALHDLGYLPVHIKALPEGARVNLRVPLWTIRNTHPQFYWITNYLETALSSEQWKMVNNATVAFEFYRLLKFYALKTGCPVEFVKWQGHDFSMRGMSGIYDAAQTGSGHLLPFYGTDTILALDYLEDYYRGAATFLGGSVPATEHSVMCMGKRGNELETFRRIIADLYPSGVCSVVSDTWNFWDVLTKFAVALKPVIEKRKPDANGLMKVVFRPDSGDPYLILCGDKRAPMGSPEYKGAIQCLWDVFGGTVNQQGYKVLNPIVGLIYGDSITLNLASAILAACEQMGFCTSCLVFGIGSYTYQCCTRDNLGQAIKSTHGVVNGEDRELYKDPITDSGMKRSAKGYLRIELEGNDYVLYDQQTREQEQKGELQTVFHNGAVVACDSVEAIRKRLGV